jgi:circadian clock protein KaiC
MAERTAKEERSVSKDPPSKRILISKTSTHINGLDDILDGGLPSRRATLVAGEPGTGKTVLGLEFIYRGAMKGDPGIFMGFEESAKILRENGRSLGWDLSALEKEGLLFLMEPRLDPDMVISGRFSLKPLLSVISGKAKELGAKRIVLDALDVLFGLFEDSFRARSELHQLNRWLADSGLTSILTLKPRNGFPSGFFPDFLYSLADCVIHLDMRIFNQNSTRRLRVVKYRGSSFGRNEYPFIISENGIRTVPITRFQLRHKPFGERVPSGIAGLDEMLGGGYHRSSCILVAGEPGSGKTLFASAFVTEACKRREKVLYVSFEESPKALMRNVASAGFDLEPFEKTGTLRLIASMPEATGIEEHLIRLIDEVEQWTPHHVIVDAISACERMGGKQVSFDFLMRLLNFLKERGTTTLLTNQTSGTKTQIEISGNGISSMVDSVIFLSYVFGEGKTNRVLQVLKSRGSKHSNEIRKFSIGDKGIEILDPYVG